MFVKMHCRIMILRKCECPHRILIVNHRYRDLGPDTDRLLRAAGHLSVLVFHLSLLWVVGSWSLISPLCIAIT
jgi:hypothetical protein